MKEKIIVGWRETLSLPALGIKSINAKIDTGAKTSCLHAFKIKAFTKDGLQWVRFWLHPRQKDDSEVIICEAPVIDRRIVRNSGGYEEKRYVIRTDLQLGTEQWSIDITLTNRENMAFRMLLGRTAMRPRIIVDPDASFLLSAGGDNI
ncbi:ATP-dependent zinc protease family protein [Vibrio mangrovi]|uniref:ATP-dependent zinc protease n=1 Tax=Vibrio mangrovi TaxID=474394 RepID=A0A1Y6IRR4_9VIBR|nr:ATP-dependent zinc protease [Vibrio mangrovi]MDW6001647.1 ATP-dependent zinc protease [Vibrio mangrovi]SMS00326.1 hypothetical protein VIM7927_01576 [Vibrio mangrovi]